MVKLKIILEEDFGPLSMVQWEEVIKLTEELAQTFKKFTDESIGIINFTGE